VCLRSARGRPAGRGPLCALCVSVVKFRPRRPDRTTTEARRTQSAGHPAAPPASTVARHRRSISSCRRGGLGGGRVGGRGAAPPRRSRSVTELPVAGPPRCRSSPLRWAPNTPLGRVFSAAWRPAHFGRPTRRPIPSSIGISGRKGPKKKGHPPSRVAQLDQVFKRLPQQVRSGCGSMGILPDLALVGIQHAGEHDQEQQRVAAQFLALLQLRLGGPLQERRYVLGHLFRRCLRAV